MTERSSSFVVNFGGDDGDIRTVLAGLKSHIRSVTSEIEATTRKVTLFEGLEQKTKAAADALAAATANAAKLAAEMEKVQKAGGKGTDELTKSLKAANTEVATATREFNRNVDAISKLQATLSRAGVDTKNLAAEQTRLAAASRAAADAAAVQASQQLLGLKTLKDVAPEIQRLNAAYNTLKASGTLSVKELATAHALLQQRVADLKGEVSSLGNVNKVTIDKMGEAWSFMTAKIFAVVGTLTTVAATYSRVSAAANAYGDTLARISTVSNLSGAELDALGSQVRQVALAMGVDLQQALEGVYELLRSGTPAENVIDVLQRSALAAKASVTDIATAVKVADGLMDGFGTTLGGLAGHLDMLVASGKNGGPTLAEFAAGGQQLFAVAQAANVPLEQLIAVLDVMTRATGSASESMSSLSKILIQLQTEEVRKKLAGLGIESTNLVDIFTQLADKQMTVDMVLDLGIGSAKAAGSVAALTENAKALNPELVTIAGSASTARQSMDALAKTAAARAAALAAEVKDLEVSFGPGSKFAAAGTFMLRLLREIDEALGRIFEGKAGTKTAAPTIADELATWASELLGIKPAADAAAAATAALGTATAQAGGQAAQAAAAVAAANAAISKATTNLSSAAERMLANAQKIQEAAVTNLGLLAKAAADQIAALDRSAAAQVDTAKKTLEIQTKLGADTLALIKANEKKVTEVTEAAIAAREQAQRRQGKTEADVAAESSRTRLAYLNQLLGQYQTEYDRLLGLSQGYHAAVRTAEHDRLTFNEGLERQLFAIRVEGMSAFDLYVTKVKESERLIAEARKAGEAGNLDLAKKYTEQAITLSGTITEAVSVNGSKIVTQSQATETKVGLLKKAQDGLNRAYETAGDSSRQGVDETERQLNRVKPILEQMRDLVKEVNDGAAQGAVMAIELDQDSVTAARETLADLTRDRTATITVRTVQANSGGGFIGRVAQAYAKGGAVGRAVMPYLQAFAGGGSVFRKPAWSKVPGTGDGDTVPALLNSGSFVLRKAASLFYGDGPMNRLVRGFAGGGGVFSAGSVAERLFGSGIAGRMLGTGTLPEDAVSLRKIKVLAQEEISGILDRASGLPAATLGQDVRDYVRKVGRLISDSNNVADAQALLDMLLVYYARFYPAIENSQRMNVPLVMGINAVPPADTTGQARNAWEQLQNSPSAWERLQAETSSWDLMNPGSAGTFSGRRSKKFAAGGSVDSVPAMLTPGEYVLKPPAVTRVAQLFGGGFLDALNSMRVPRGFFDGVMNLAPPRPLAFANGGPVPGGGALPSTGSGGSGKVRDVHLHFHAQRVDADEVRRTIIPELNKVMKSSR